MNAQHTPTPYQKDLKTVYSMEAGFTIAFCKSEEDAAFIARACSSHDALVAALKDCRDWIKLASESDPRISIGVMEAASAALAAAGEGA